MFFQHLSLKTDKKIVHIFEGGFIWNGTRSPEIIFLELSSIF